ncbi:MAG TPA: caspase family protein [Hyphomonas sp.]|nr:caspase family protein [Hyphomonas sp.]
MRLAAMVWAFLLCCLQGALAEPDKGVGAGYCADHSCRALLIANDDYLGPDGWHFETSVPAAQAVNKALLDVGFQTTVLINATREDMLQAFAAFREMPDVDVSLAFYAGNGFSADDVPLMFPVDATANGLTAEDLIGGTIPYSRLFNAQPGERMHINIYDAGTIPMDQYFPDISNTKGALLVDYGALYANMFPLQPRVETINLYSARVGQGAFDAPLFGEILAEAIGHPGDIIRALAQVPDRMAVETDLGQYPQIDIQSASGERLCLVSCEAVTKSAGPSIAEVRQELEQGVCEGDLTAGRTAANRYALVIGNNGYQNNDAWGRLTQPVQDADTMAAALTATGFKVRKCHNLTLEGMRRETRDFQDFYDAEVENAPGGVTPAAFFYFSGHGAADSEGNYLIPTDSEADAADELQADALSVNQFASRFADEGGQTMIVIDACRNALKSSDSKSDFKGMTRIKAWPNMIVASATQPGALARQDSGYAALLAERITRPGIPFYESEARFVFDDVGKAVETDTKGEQRPVVDSQFSGRFFFQAPKPEN